MYEGSCTTFTKVKIRKSVKIRKTSLMTKKRSSGIFAAKMEIFQKKTSSWSTKNFPSPQTRRQVFATALVSTPLGLSGSCRIATTTFTLSASGSIYSSCLQHLCRVLIRGIGNLVYGLIESLMSLYSS